jgi:hypothetical protein
VRIKTASLALSYRRKNLHCYTPFSLATITFMSSRLTQSISLLHETAKGLQSEHNQDENEATRLELLKIARSIVVELEKPHEVIMRMLYNDSATFMCSKILSDLGIFNLLAVSEEPLTTRYLSQVVNADNSLVERLLKHAATASFVDETGEDVYCANEITRCCASPGGKGAIDDVFQLLPVVGAVPQFLKETQYRNPRDKNKTAWKYAFNTDQHFFEYVNAPGRESNLEALRNHMDFKTVGQRWFEVPKLTKSLFENAVPGKTSVMLVDVGGSGGHDIQAFRAAKPTLEGRLILQDLPTTIDSLDSNAFSQEGIEIMGHDFFTPQPVHGARIYYLKMCLHDWPDDDCAKILRHLRLAMTPGYSRILLDEIIVPDTGAHWFDTSVDLLMMEVHSAQERREREWHALVGKVHGLHLRKIWKLEGSFNKIVDIEAV